MNTITNAITDTITDTITDSIIDKVLIVDIMDHVTDCMVSVLSN